MPGCPDGVETGPTVGGRSGFEVNVAKETTSPHSTGEKKKYFLQIKFCSPIDKTYKYYSAKNVGRIRRRPSQVLR